MYESHSQKEAPRYSYTECEVVELALPHNIQICCFRSRDSTRSVDIPKNIFVCWNESINRVSVSSYGKHQTAGTFECVHDICITNSNKEQTICYTSLFQIRFNEYIFSFSITTFFYQNTFYFIFSNWLQLHITQYVL